MSAHKKLEAATVVNSPTANHMEILTNKVKNIALSSLKKQGTQRKMAAIRTVNFDRQK